MGEPCEQEVPGSSPGKYFFEPGAVATVQAQAAKMAVLPFAQVRYGALSA